MDKDQVYQKYKRLGIISLFPLIIIGYFSIYISQGPYHVLSTSNFPEDFNWRTNMGKERILGILLFLLLYSGILSGIISSISYWIAGHRKDEKWLGRAQNFRIFPWILVILFGLGIMGIIASQILYRL